jgi:hypothetical protein
MNRFLSVITFVITVILIAIVCTCIDDQSRISVLENRVDSLVHECNRKDTMLDEATSTAIQLNDRLNTLYEVNPSVHKQVFEK